MAGSVIVSSSTTRTAPRKQKMQRVVHFSSISPKNNSDKKKQKQVCFASKCCFKRTISINDMTEKEIRNSWIQQDEQRGIRRRCRELVAGRNYNRTTAAVPTTAAAADSNITKNDEETYRGLESYTKHGKQRKKMNRLEAIMLVLEEQEKQHLENAGSIYDEEEIAFAYKEISAECQFQAELRAMQDRKEVEKEIKNELNPTGSNYVDNKNKSKNSNIKNIIKSTVTSATTTDATSYSCMRTPSITKTTIASAAA